MILRPGYLITVYNSSQEVVGYAYSDPAAPTTSYWSMPPVTDRPPDPGVWLFVNPGTANVTYAGFISTVRANWSSNSRFLTCTETTYTSYDSIPQQDRAKFFPGTGGSGATGVPRQVDTGSTGIYMVREGGSQLNVGAAYRDNVTQGEYDEYWVLGSAYDATKINAMTAGTINSSFGSWQPGMTCVLVSTVETSTAPAAV